MKHTLRVIFVIAAVGALAALLGSLTPVRGYVSPDMTVPGHAERPDRVDQISCGSFIAPAQWSARDGCEDVRFRRAFYVAIGLVVALIFGLVGNGHVDVRSAATSNPIRDVVPSLTYRRRGTGKAGALRRWTAARFDPRPIGNAGYLTPVDASRRHWYRSSAAIPIGLAPGPSIEAFWAPVEPTMVGVRGALGSASRGLPVMRSRQRASPQSGRPHPRAAAGVFDGSTVSVGRLRRITEPFTKCSGQRPTGGIAPAREFRRDHRNQWCRRTAP